MTIEFILGNAHTHTHSTRKKDKCSASNFPLMKYLTENHNLTKAIDKPGKMPLTSRAAPGFVFQRNILSNPHPYCYLSRLRSHLPKLRLDRFP